MNEYSLRCIDGMMNETEEFIMWHHVTNLVKFVTLRNRLWHKSQAEVAAAARAAETIEKLSLLLIISAKKLYQLSQSF